MNSMIPSIQFTVEEEENQLTLLNVLIISTGAGF